MPIDVDSRYGYETFDIDMSGVGMTDISKLAAQHIKNLQEVKRLSIVSDGSKKTLPLVGFISPFRMFPKIVFNSFNRK